jgi:hypothetical protein
MQGTDIFTGLANWKLQGEFSDALVAMGLHRTNSINHRKRPFWNLQLRRQIFAACYCRDKWFSCLLGRPPRLGYKFCHFELPLELSVGELLSGQQPGPLLSLVDESGWDKRDTVNWVTWLRLRAQYCAIREDILEISLGNTMTTDDLQWRTEVIHQKIRQFSDRLPGKIQRRVDHALECLSKQSLTTRGGSGLLSALAVHLGMLQTRYLLHRALFTQTLALPDEIIDTAREILNLVLQVVAAQELFHDWPGDIASLVSCRISRQGIKRVVG